MVYRTVNLLGAVLFGYAAAVQTNDPDPVQWMVLYGAAALFCTLAVLDRAPPVATGTFGAAALVLAVMASQAMPGETNPMAGFPSWEPLQEETVRETLGLALVGVWMVGVGLVARARRRDRRKGEAAPL